MSNHNAGSVTGWIKDLQRKDPEAQRKILDRFMVRLENYAQKILQQRGCNTVGRDDIAIMSFTSLFLRSPDEFAKLVNRNDLWQLLIVIAERRVIDQVRRELSLKHGARKIFSETDYFEQDTGQGIDGFPRDASPPDMEAILMEELECRLESLGDSTMRAIAICKMHDFSNQEIAAKIGISIRSVERKLAHIRGLLKSATC